MDAVTPPTITAFLRCLDECSYFVCNYKQESKFKSHFNLIYFLFLSHVDLFLTLRPTQTGIPIIIAGTAIPAINPIPTGAPTSVPSCHKIFFFLLHGFLPQNVHPEGLKIQETGSH